MRKSVAAILLVLAGGACSESGPSSRAIDDPTVSTAPTTIAGAASTLGTVVIVSTTAPPATTVAGATSTPVVVVTSAPGTTAAVGTTTTVATTFPTVQNLEEGDHIGIVAAVDATGFSFDRVDAVDADGDGNPESYTNSNPALRAVPLPDNVLLDGEVRDAATVAQQLTGIQVLVRITVVGQRLAAIERLPLTV